MLLACFFAAEQSTYVPSAPYVSSRTPRSISINYFAVTATAAKWASFDRVALYRTEACVNKKIISANR